MPSIQPVVMCVMKHLPKVGALHWLAWCDLCVTGVMWSVASVMWCVTDVTCVTGVRSLVCLWQVGSAPSAPLQVCCSVSGTYVNRFNRFLYQWTKSEGILSFHNQTRLFSIFFKPCSFLKKSSLLLGEFFHT